MNIEKNVYVETEEDPDLMTKRAPFNTSVPRFELNKSKILKFIFIFWYKIKKRWFYPGGGGRK